MIRKLASLGLAAFAGSKLFARNAAKIEKVGHKPRDLDRDSACDRSRSASPHYRPGPHGHVREDHLDGLRPVSSRQPLYIVSGRA